MPNQNTLSPPDLSAVFEFQESSTREGFGVSLATLLQCLCIAEQCHLVPPLEADWEAISIPKALREMSEVPKTPLIFR